MEYNAFVGGIAPGGLTNDFEVKILICYLLSKLNQPVSFSLLNEVFGKTSVVNYFEYTEALSELKTTGQISKEPTDSNEEVYVLTELGRAAAEEFGKTLPRSVRDKTLETARSILDAARRDAENCVQISEVQDGYQLTLTVKDIGTDLMNLTLFLPTLEECERVKQSFLEDPFTLYQGALALARRDLASLKAMVLGLDK